LDAQEDWDFVNQLETLFLSRGAEVFYVELEADYDLRIERNKTENRLLNKSTKRDIGKSEALFRRLEEKYRLNSLDGEFMKDNYLKINNTNLEPEMVARMIQEKFNL
jgi:hypothetical protein